MSLLFVTTEAFRFNQNGKFEVKTPTSMFKASQAQYLDRKWISDRRELVNYQRTTDDPNYFCLLITGKSHRHDIEDSPVMKKIEQLVTAFYIFISTDTKQSAHK